MSAAIRNDPNGEIQTAIDAIIKRTLELHYPCLIDGHTADENASMRATTGGIGLSGLRRDGDNFVRPFVEIPLKLCARCGVVYEEKSK